MREELVEGIEHLRLAAAHAAGGAAGAIAPRLDAARDRVEPKVSRSVEWVTETARDSARQANQAARKAKGKKRGASMTRSRWPMMIGGLLIAGAAAGAVGALISRRRQQKWQEFGSTGRPATGFEQEASVLADTAKEKASDVLGQVKSTMPPTGDKTGEFGQSGDAYSQTGTSAGISKNSRP
jgi:hypothetical protein